MKRKLDLLDRAHTLLRNAPANGDVRAAAEWHKMVADWITGYEQVITDQRAGKHGRRAARRNQAVDVVTANEAIASRELAEREDRP